MRNDDVLARVKARLACARLSTRPWLCQDQGTLAVAFDDSDTLHPNGPWTWQAVEVLIKSELWSLGLFGLSTAWKPDTGVVRIAYAPR